MEEVEFIFTSGRRKSFPVIWLLSNTVKKPLTVYGISLLVKVIRNFHQTRFGSRLYDVL